VKDEYTWMRVVADTVTTICRSMSEATALCSEVWSEAWFETTNN